MESGLKKTKTKMAIPILVCHETVPLKPELEVFTESGIQKTKTKIALARNQNYLDKKMPPKRLLALFRVCALFSRPGTPV